MYDKSQEGKQERAYECWARVADEKVVRFNVDAGKVEQVTIGGAGLSPLDIQKAFCVLLDLGVDQIDIPKALIEKNGVDVSAFFARDVSENGYLFSANWLQKVDDPPFPVPDGVFVYENRSKKALYAFDGKALRRCVNARGEYVTAAGEGYKAKMERLAKEAAERQAAEEEAKRQAAEKAEQERRNKNLQKLASMEQGKFDKLIEFIMGK